MASMLRMRVAASVNGHEGQDTRDPPQVAGGKVRSRSCGGRLTVHSWSSECITGADEGSDGDHEHKDTREALAGCRRESSIGELQRTFGHAFLEQLAHHQLVPDEGGDGHERQDTREPPQSAGGKV
ncbi:hypothetical protein [Paenibacillus elgii]|uniref:hypothetical protein n=1 Tax=Paenibacillus elgii TaxID=189691 RepID=UPI0013D7267F|nr:hypothetical protein [Paenibacillus elgii]